MSIRRFLRVIFCAALCCISCAALWCVAPAPASARDADDRQPGAIWTAIIPDAFPHYVYTWHMRPDGTYREDGRDTLSGAPIQQTLSGRWSREGARMILRQDDLPFVFDGVVSGNLYAGTLYFGGRSASRFCAARGEQAPARCDPGGIAGASPGPSAFTRP